MEPQKEEAVRSRFSGSMDSLHVEKLLVSSGGSLYSLVRMAMLRALELADGKPCLVKNPLTEKLATIALQEISLGKVVTKSSLKLKS